VELVRDKWTCPVSEVVIGATNEEGGTRTSIVKIGGETTLPYLLDEGQMPNKPVVAMEVWDISPGEDWAEELTKIYGNVAGDPSKWAKKCVEEFGAEMIAVRLQGTHPDWGDKDAKHAVDVVKSVLSAISVPLIILGSGHDEKDNAVLPQVSQAAAGERCLIGNIKEKNYKTIVASAIADGHNIIGESPLDINIAKQVNILATDMGIGFERLVMYPTNGGLGYGLEYAYSIMERSRIAGLGGDKMLAMPMLCVMSTESWRCKEAKAPEADFPEWGDTKNRGIMWEALGATTYLLGGADILIMWHPEAVKIVKETIGSLM
ncbi:MAG: acetyl-CoA decarbonylase/synthase complex subunit delta, partial [bacterium]